MPIGSSRRAGSLGADLDHFWQDLTIPIWVWLSAGRGWEPPFPLGASAFFSVTWTERQRCQGSLDWLCPSRRLRVLGGGGRLGWGSPFILCAVGSSSLLPPHPHDLSRPRGTRKLLQPHLFPFLPSAPGAPCLPGSREGTTSSGCSLSGCWNHPLATPWE